MRGNAIIRLFSRTSVQDDVGVPTSRDTTLWRGRVHIAHEPIERGFAPSGDVRPVQRSLARILLPAPLAALDYQEALVEIVTRAQSGRVTAVFPETRQLLVTLS